MPLLPQLRRGAATFARPRVAAAIATLTLALVSLPAAAETSREKQQRKLDFLVGSWSTSHVVPAAEGKTITISGSAVIEWAVGRSWLRHEFEAEDPVRGPVSLLTLMNYSPNKGMYNLYLFDHFGGEAGAFYGDWNDSDQLVVTARFEEEDGTVSYQRFTLTPVSEDEFRFDRAFSDDGDHYHFELKGAYSRLEG